MCVCVQECVCVSVSELKKMLKKTARFVFQISQIGFQGARPLASGVE